MKSILQDKKECFICHNPLGCEQHHVIHGTANRKIADREGLWVWLCHDHHTGIYGVHSHRDMDLGLIQMAQTKYEETHTRDEWRSLFGKSWL